MKIAVISVLLASGYAVAAPFDQATTDKARTLVAQLASPQYRVRERAATELLRLGRGAVVALTEGKKHPDPEVWMRCEQLLPQARALDLEHRIDVFLKDADLKGTHDLPLWNVYAKAIGTTPADRALYVEMLRVSGHLLEAIDDEPDRVTERIRLRIQELYMDVFGNPNMAWRGEMPAAKYQPAEIAALMFAMTRPAFKPTQPDWYLSSVYANGGPFVEKLKNEKEGAAYRKVFFHHVGERPDENTVNQVVWMLSQHRIPGSAELFVKVLEGKSTMQVYTKAQVIAGLGTVGTRDHCKVIEPFLKDTTQVQPFFAGRGGQQGEVRLGDIALAVTIHLHGKNPKDFGFIQWRTYPGQMIPYHMLGFTDEEARKASFKKWADDPKTPDAKKDGPKSEPKKQAPKEMKK
ncbi:MAG TPA: hypothetical protein VM597_12620 [Gemmataceae bacterium]|nr:hypothetical protein [Gemmataceae bacterium]